MCSWKPQTGVERYTYDIKGTTNYGGVFAEQTGIDGMREVARYVRTEVLPKVHGLAVA